LLGNTDIVRKVTPYFLLQIYVLMFCQYANYTSCSDGCSCRLIQNVVIFVYVEFMFVNYTLCF
jgi:hypothetical protein